MNMRASLENFAFSHSKLLFPSIFCWCFCYSISETYIFSGLKLQSALYIYHQCSSLLLLMVWRYIFKRQYTNKTLTLRESMNMRASLENFAFSHSRTAISFNIMLVLLILYLRNIIYIFRSQITICIIHIS